MVMALVDVSHFSVFVSELGKKVRGFVAKQLLSLILKIIFY